MSISITIYPALSGHTKPHVLENVLSSTKQPESVIACDFHMLASLKKVLKGRRLWSDENMNAVVVQWLQQQPM
jgi:hypothetical protein